ncbi:MAG: diacylglycerol kinase family lipid kinase, partial [Phycisphaerales bacterium]|nr:diacylglycerol kinase family lipid kinase [Phycisphaerales bacterium]
GDGTLSGALDGLGRATGATFRGVTLGLIPLGTGNDFARSIGVPLETDAAVKTLLARHTRDLDLVRLITTDEHGNAHQPRFFINAAAAGLSGVVSEQTGGDLKETWGKLAYAITAAKVLPQRDVYSLSIELDGPQGPETLGVDALGMMVGNGRTAAGGVPVTPWAELDDGLLEVLVAPRMAMADLALVMASVLASTHRDHESLITRRAHSLRVTSDPPMPISADGELMGVTPATFEVIPRALTVIVGTEMPPAP